MKQINNKFYDVVHIYRTGQNEEFNWFNCTDLESRFSVNESKLDAGILVFKSISSAIQESDNGIYKCEANSETYSIQGKIHWNKTIVDWTCIYTKKFCASYNLYTFNNILNITENVKVGVSPPTKSTKWLLFYSFDVGMTCLLYIFKTLELIKVLLFILHNNSVIWVQF